MMEGIFDTDQKRSPWAQANKVYLGYCSSDAWVGNSSFNSNPVGWSFRGSHILASTLQLLVSNYSLGDSQNPTRVLLAGCSAGARGAMANLDYVATLLPTGVQLRGFFDSALWITLAPFEAGTLPLQNQTEGALILYNASARLGPSCASLYTGEEWKCLFGQYRFPTLRTQYFSSDSQFDAFQLPYDEGALPPYTGAQLSYAAIYQRNIRAQLLALPASQQGGSAVYSSACFKHCTSTSNAFWGVKVDGTISLRDHVGAWFFGGPLGSRPQVIEACNGFGCGQCSGPAPATLYAQTHT